MMPALLTVTLCGAFVVGSFLLIAAWFCGNTPWQEAWQGWTK